VTVINTATVVQRAGTPHRTTLLSRFFHLNDDVIAISPGLRAREIRNGSGEGSPVAGLQEFPRSLNSAEKEGKLAHASTKLLIWCENSAEERESVMSSLWRVANAGDLRDS
jgi:hypothetical protein